MRLCRADLAAAAEAAAGSVSGTAKLGTGRGFSSLTSAPTGTLLRGACGAVRCGHGCVLSLRGGGEQGVGLLHVQVRVLHGQLEEAQAGRPHVLLLRDGTRKGWQGKGEGV